MVAVAEGFDTSQDGDELYSGINSIYIYLFIYLYLYSYAYLDII